jgi:hypothetical protein
MAKVKTTIKARTRGTVKGSGGRLPKKEITVMRTTKGDTGSTVFVSDHEKGSYTHHFVEDKGFYGHMDPSKIKRQKIRGSI